LQNVQHLIGLPVLLANGRQAGRVQDIGFDEFWRLSCIILDKRIWFRKAVYAVDWADVAACGDDALVVSARAVLRKIPRHRLLRTFQTGIVKLKELPVYTVEGRELGRVADVYFRSPEGTQIIGYELTDGFLADVFEGRRRLILPEGSEGVSLGENAILVPASCERVLTREPYAESDR
jgi:uncharacterized protein YrrD